MPRFLHTYTGEFHWVADPSEVVYAILSHTWQLKELGEEQSYASILALQAQVRHTTNAQSANAELSPIFFSDDLSDKIKNACDVARKAGYKLIWIDSGCIDKSSSAELAEAINSMFELYRLADVCFVYLADVPDGQDPHGNSKFQTSRWHVRGWTLQELIAPKNVVFLTQTWTFLGTKAGLASTLEQVTRVDVDILMGRAPVDSASVARRMSWAATRETTRVEDEAYSLLGIFGVHLSPIYGEGRNAFLRLQEEILKYIPDQTIFAWGNTHLDMAEYRHSSQRPENGSTPVEDYRSPSSVNDPIHWHSLLAPSPVPFLNARDAVLLPPTAFSKRLQLSNSGVQVPPLRCVFTPQGVGLTFLTIGCAEGGPFDWIARDLHGTTGTVSQNTNPVTTRCEHTQGVIEYIALLQCEATPSSSVIALALLRPTSEVEQNMGLRVATRSCDCEGSRSCRLVYISPAALSTIRRHLLPTELYLRRDLPPAPPPPGSIPTWQGAWGEKDAASITLWSDRPTEFRVAPWCKESLGAFGVSCSLLPVQTPKEDGRMSHVQTVLLTSSLTSNNSDSVFALADDNVRAIEITLSLKQLPDRTKPSDDTICRFHIKNNFSGSLQELLSSPEVSFNTNSIPVSPRQRAIHEAVFEVQQDLFGTSEEYQDRQQGRRLLRLSLECPPDLLYPRWMTSDYSTIIPWLLISIELSDVLHAHHGQAKGSVEPPRALTEPRGHLGPFKRFLGNAGLQVLRQPKKLVESIRGRGRRAEGSPRRS